MAGDHPASYSISHTQQWILALMSPFMMILITVPFTFLRIILLGWNCTLTRQFWEEEEEEGLEPSKASRGRNCLTVCCGVSGMMMLTNILMILVVVVIIFHQSFNSSLTKDSSD